MTSLRSKMYVRHFWSENVKWERRSSPNISFVRDWNFRKLKWLIKTFWRLTSSDDADHKSKVELFPVTSPTDYKFLLVTSSTSFTSDHDAADNIKAFLPKGHIQHKRLNQNATKAICWLSFVTLSNFLRLLLLVVGLLAPKKNNFCLKSGMKKSLIKTLLSQFLRRFRSEGLEEAFTSFFTALSSGRALTRFTAFLLSSVRHTTLSAVVNWLKCIIQSVSVHAHIVLPHSTANLAP